MAVSLTDSQSVTSILSEIADIASETLELDEVFDRVADSVRKLVPFENIGVVRIVDGHVYGSHPFIVQDQPLTANLAKVVKIQTHPFGAVSKLRDVGAAQ